jgi:Zn-dependent protease with chaperone function
MFALRGLAVSLAIFFLVYSVLSLLIVGSWEVARRYAGRYVLSGSANFLFFIRLLPLLGAFAFTLAFTLPSFLILEPRSAQEAVGAAPTTLGICCLTLLFLGLARASLAQTKASQVLANWLQGAHRVRTCSKIPVFQTRKGTPLLTVAGVRAPRVLVSGVAMEVLQEGELEIALRHEVAHVRHLDNLKKLLMQFSPFPGMQPLERAWAQAAELEADDAAVSSMTDALDLASALIKLSRISSPESPLLAANLLPEAHGSIRTRVERLFAWDRVDHSHATDRSWFYATPVLLTAVVAAAATYGAVIEQIHEVTEWLVR